MGAQKSRKSHRHPFAGLLALVAAGLLVATGCSAIRGERVETGFSSEEPEEPSELAFADSAPRAVNESATFVDAETPTLQPFVFTADALLSDEQISGVELYQDRPTIVTFVTPTCPVCETEGPFIAEAAHAFPELTIAVVHSQGDEAQHVSYVEHHQLELPNVVHISDPDMDLWARFNVISQPSSVLVTSAGTATFASGALGINGYERAVELLTS